MCLWLSAAMEVIVFLQIALLGRRLAGDDNLAVAAAVTGILAIAVALTTIVLFCRFMYLANRNARSFGAELEESPNWAWLSFFIPIANLWKPYYALKEIWQASVLPDDPRLTWISNPVPPLFPLWWWAYLVGTMTIRVADLVERRTAQASSFVLATQTLSMLATAASAVIATRIIRQLLRRQETRNNQLTTAITAAVG